MSSPKILAMVMAGGGGSRLHPLTAQRSKPSIPFGARYRIVDFVLSNLINSQIHAIYLLVQYKSQSLIEHIRKSWVISPVIPDHFVAVVPPQMREGPEWFQGTADAVYQNLNLIEHYDPDLVAVFGADHVYRMDVSQMVAYHLESGADATVAALPVPIGHASAFGVIATDSAGRVLEFQEKPACPRSMPDDPDRSYASMGNYLFKTDVLLKALREAHRRGEHDFGHHVLPNLLSTHRLFAYDFSNNTVPGTKPYEESAYWRDIGDIDMYFAAHQDLLGPEPSFDLFNPRWPIYSSNYGGPGARVIHGNIHNSVLAAGTMIRGATVRNCVIHREVFIEDGADLSDCIIMDYVLIKAGARLRRAIVDRYNTIEAETTIGYDPDSDRERYHVTAGGITVIPEWHSGPHMISFLENYVLE
jgi:glucose-1-phosphate adenylyltransferase